MITLYEHSLNEVRSWNISRPFGTKSQGRVEPTD